MAEIKSFARVFLLKQPTVHPTLIQRLKLNYESRLIQHCAYGIYFVIFQFISQQILHGTPVFFILLLLFCLICCRESMSLSLYQVKWLIISLSIFNKMSICSLHFPSFNGTMTESQTLTLWLKSMSQNSIRKYRNSDGRVVCKHISSN